MEQILLEDASGSMTCLQFEKLGVDSIAVPLCVMYMDHNMLGPDEKNMDEHHYLQSFCARYGVLYSRPGNGISHYIHLERYARPGHVLIGADSHTTLGGAAAMLAIGVGGLDAAVAMSGHGFWLQCPRVIGVELHGRLPDFVEAKDVILELLRRHGVRGGNGKVFEFYGDGAETLSTTERATICNMVMETGALTGVFPSDERVRQWLAFMEREEHYIPLTADPGATYDETEMIDLSSLEPLIAKPQSPGNVVAVRELAGTRTAQVCVGSSVNSSYEDLATVAAILRENIVHPTVEMTVTPGSRQILDVISRTGVYQDLVAAGARMLEPICGPCIGIGQAPSAGVPSVRTFNRNFPGRSGTQGDQVYLCSPSTAAATALRGEITDPRVLGKPPVVEPPRYNPAMDDRHILAPPPAEERRSVQLVKGPNIIDPPEGTAVQDELEGRVLIVVEDDVSTGDMAPDGMVGMSVWSNIPECAKYMFRRQDPGFPDRALAAGGGFIVGGHNYGQGSSREHAALSPVYLGVRGVIAKSIARIHWQNLIAQGILPLLFENEDDYSDQLQGQTLKIHGVREALASGGKQLLARVDSGHEIRLRVSLLPREAQILLAGGTIKYLRHGARQPEDVATNWTSQCPRDVGSH